LATTILSFPDWDLADFDQRFYTTIAYNIDRHGVFANGTFDNVDSAAVAPPPGMFFGPVYPMLVLVGMKIDGRFSGAVSCSVEAILSHRDQVGCEAYESPMRIMHAFLLAIAVLMIALAADVMSPGAISFWLAGGLATAGLAMEAEIFSFVMTESVTVAVYSIFAFCIVLAWTSRRTWHFVLAGGLLGVLCLTRPSYTVLFPLIAILIPFRVPRPGLSRLRFAVIATCGFALGFGAIAGAWATRNLVSVGKFGLTEEYGAVTLIERFAYNDMTLHEILVAFPYCMPGIGDLLFDPIYGTDSMHRFVYHTAGSFFHTGRDKRNELVARHGRLDPIIGEIVRDEIRANGWRHLMVSIPLGWCGMWAGKLVALLLIPLFMWRCVQAIGEAKFVLLFYAAPAIIMLGLHAAVANQYTRYNLILIGPFAIGAAWIISRWVANIKIFRRLLPSASQA
jgi:hypothetical protein